MDASRRRDFGRRSFLKYGGLAVGAGWAAMQPKMALAGGDLGHRFVQVVNGARLYMTHYALFEEPDPNVPQALYFDAATGLPTQELFLAPPLTQRSFSRARGPVLSAPPETSKLLPYVVSPPGFPPQPPPDQLVGFIQAVTGIADPALVRANTNVLIVAIGQFLGAGPSAARLHGPHFSVDKTVHFEVRIRLGFLFTPPAGASVPPIGVLTTFLTQGLLRALIPQLPPASNPNEVIVYSWSAPMTLSTDNQYIRSIATEPPPVADPFEAGQKQIEFVGKRIDHSGGYTLVGSAGPSQVTFQAPPELQFFLFGTNALTDVEFAVEESGVLVPAECGDD
jgi:hypothetical protein